MYDTQIQPEIRVTNVEGVPLVSSEDLVEAPRGAAIALDLGQTGDTGFHESAEFIGVDYGRETGAVFIHVWSWSNDAHMSGEHIQKLGKLIQVAIAEETTDKRDAGVMFRGLLGIGFGVYTHGAEFQAGE